MQFLTWDELYRDRPADDPLRYYWRALQPRVAGMSRRRLPKLMMPHRSRGKCGSAAGQLHRQQAGHQSQGVMHKAYAPPHSAHRSGQLDGAADRRPPRDYASAQLRQTTSSSSVRSDSRAATQSGSRLKVVRGSRQYQRAISVPAGVLRG